jgi:pimeloyl-ACP methyl ester carboxylesterase
MAGAFRSPEARAQLIGKYDAIIRSWPVPCEERDVATTFGTTHIVVSGPASAPPLVLLDGACTTSAMWSPIIAPPAGSCRCYCIDTITDGSKCVPAQRVTGASRHVDRLRVIFSALAIENARVAGLSYGGWLALLLAEHAPELVNRLVLVCPAGTFAPLSAGFMVRMSASSLLRSLSSATGRSSTAVDLKPLSRAPRGSFPTSARTSCRVPITS